MRNMHYLCTRTTPYIMKTPLKILFLAAVAALAASCCACRSYQKRTRRPLEGTLWQLVQLDGQDVR